MRLLFLPILAATLNAQVDTSYRVPVPAPETPDRTIARYEQALRDLARQWIHDSSLVNRRWAAILLRSHRDPSLDQDLVDSLQSGLRSGAQYREEWVPSSRRPGPTPARSRPARQCRWRQCWDDSGMRAPGPHVRRVPCGRGWRRRPGAGLGHATFFRLLLAPQSLHRIHTERPHCRNECRHERR
jgi:hypothetical protein